ncbi:MAG: NUDIX hydrolase [Thermotogaceae bacterium]|nr:NUDIX hydrolase [Thermotogota bacterium]NLZ14218.1 NUDIX hydrolase [Thermotogaceae bacterium]HQQ65842.1 NUDIX hydrolase [Thermotogota bacterium]
MNQLYEKELSREYLYRGRIVRLRVDQVELENGNIAQREIIEHNGAVAVLPFDTERRVHLVSQYRKPIERVLLEVPAGKLEIGEDPLVCAKRELQEETGLYDGEVIPLGYIYTTPGFCDEKIYLFVAFNLKRGEDHPDPDEFLNVERLPWDVFITRCTEGQLTDAKTLAIALRARAKVEAYFSDKENR